MPSSSAAWSSSKVSSFAAMASSSSEHPQVDGGESSPRRETSPGREATAGSETTAGGETAVGSEARVGSETTPGSAATSETDPEPSIVAAPNLGECGKSAAPTQSSTQKAARYLSRRGRITCGCREGERGQESARERERVGIDIQLRCVCVRGESLQVLGVLLATRLVLGVLLARHERRELRDNTEVCTSGLAPSNGGGGDGVGWRMGWTWASGMHVMIMQRTGVQSRFGVYSRELGWHLAHRADSCKG